MAFRDATLTTVNVINYAKDSVIYRDKTRKTSMPRGENTENKDENKEVRRTKDSESIKPCHPVWPLVGGICVIPRVCVSRRGAAGAGRAEKVLHFSGTERKVSV